MVILNPIRLHTNIQNLNFSNCLRRKHLLANFIDLENIQHLKTFVVKLIALTLRVSWYLNVKSYWLTIHFFYIFWIWTIRTFEISPFPKNAKLKSISLITLRIIAANVENIYLPWKNFLICSNFVDLHIISIQWHF